MTEKGHAQPTPLGARIAHVRKERGWTRTRLATEVGISYWTITEWEVNGIYPTYESLDTFCRALNISPCHLMGIPCKADHVREKLDAMRMMVDDLSRSCAGV